MAVGEECENGSAASMGRRGVWCVSVWGRVGGGVPNSGKGLVGWEAWGKDTRGAGCAQRRLGFGGDILLSA